MKTHLANPTEQEALCGRSTGVIKHLGTNRLVALTDDKCRSCLKTATYTSNLLHGCLPNPTPVTD